MNNKENIFSSLVSSKIIKPVNDEKQENVLKWKANPAPGAQKQFFPLSFSFSQNGDYWLLPYETMITINGGHTIIKRNVAKKKWPIKGAIKERWAQNDYEITITGALFGKSEIGSVEECYPIRDFEILRDFLTKQPVIWVLCEPLSLLGINKIVIEEFSFPFTKGENVQTYEIKAVSDFDFVLLLKLKETGK